MTSMSPEYGPEVTVQPTTVQSLYNHCTTIVQPLCKVVGIEQLHVTSRTDVRQNVWQKRDCCICTGIKLFCCS